MSGFYRCADRNNDKYLLSALHEQFVRASDYDSSLSGMRVVPIGTAYDLFLIHHCCDFMEVVEDHRFDEEFNRYEFPRKDLLLTFDPWEHSSTHFEGIAENYWVVGEGYDDHITTSSIFESLGIFKRFSSVEYVTRQP